MAILSFLFSFVAKQMSKLLQAIFGWSVTALFGRLSGRKQIAVTVALVLSIAWPIFLVGLIVPSVAGWVLAFLPLEKWLGPVVLRIVWGALALCAPLLVGALVRWAAPSKKGGYARAFVNGYPLALGFFIAFLVTAITVPAVKVASILKGWSDEHVYVQARNGAYDRALADLAEAFARAGLVPEVSQPSRSMTIATSVLRVLARGAVSPIVAEQVMRVRGKNVEAILYPSDLLLRGSTASVARIRAMLSRTHLDGDAYLVQSDAAQCIQDELHRLIEVVDRHDELGEDLGGMFDARLSDVWREANESDLPFEEWVMLEAIARRLERRIVRRTAGVDVLPLDREGDAFASIAAKMNARAEKPKEKTDMAIEMPRSAGEPELLDETPTTQLVKEALDEAKELVRLEVQMAKEEAKLEVKKLEGAGIAFGVGALSALMMLSMLCVAIVLAFGGTVVAALLVAAAFLVIAGVAGAVGYTLLPKKPLEHTRNRLESDVNQLKEHLA